jgi:UDP-N-acetyl-D-glucosamine dehydrogenase
MASPAEELSSKIASRSALVGVVGLGYVGLPLVRVFVEADFRVLGFDTDAAKVARLARGESYIGHLPSEWIARAVGDERFSATADMTRLAEPDAILICVPTPLKNGREPDLQFVEATAQQIAATLRPGQLVVLESTTYPGTTRDVVLPILASSGLASGRDFFLAYSPEREDPGNPNFSAGTIPKLVGGIDAESLGVASMLYRAAVKEVVPVSSCEVAEAAKLLENTYRAVNIALVNELKKVFAAMQLDVWEVIDAAETKPFGFQAFAPGPGLGGHCIPIDPFYLSWLARRHGVESRFVELAGEVNTTMPAYVVERVAEALATQGKLLAGSKICLLGVAYKRDVDDPRESPAFRLIELLSERGAEISYNDPHIPRLPTMRRYRVPALESRKLTPEFLASQDCILIVTDHSAYDYATIVRHAQLVVDTRNATRNVPDGRAKIHKA